MRFVFALIMSLTLFRTEAFAAVPAASSSSASGGGRPAAPTVAVMPPFYMPAFETDKRVSHLPQPMRRAALDFFRGFVGVCAPFYGLPSTVALEGETCTSVLAALATMSEHDTPPELGTAAVCYIDCILCTRGWGRRAIEIGDYAGDSEDTGFDDFDNDAAKDMPEAVHTFVFEQTRVGNPVAAYFSGILSMREDEVGAAYDALLMAARGMNFRAARFLNSNAAGLFRGIPQHPDVLAFALLDSRNNRKNEMERIISTRPTDPARSLSKRAYYEEVIRRSLLSLPGNTGRYMILHRMLTTALNVFFVDSSRPAYASPDVGTVSDTILGAGSLAAGVGYMSSPGIDDTATQGEGGWFLLVGVMMLRQAIDRCCLLRCGIDLVSCITCGCCSSRLRWNRYSPIEPREFLLEAKLVAAHYMLSVEQTELEDTSDEDHRSHLLQRVREVFSEHALSKGDKNLARYVTM